MPWQFAIGPAIIEHPTAYKNMNSRYKVFNSLYRLFADINKQAENMLYQLIKEVAGKEDMTGQLKSEQPMLWVKQMNIDKIIICFCNICKKQGLQAQQYPPFSLRLVSLQMF